MRVDLMNEEQRLLRSAIASVVPRSILKALHSPSGHGNFSSSAADKLIAAGLCDCTWHWTDKGCALREVLGIED